MSNIKIAIWNANGLIQNIQEIKAFVSNQNIDNYNAYLRNPFNGQKSGCYYF